MNERNDVNVIGGCNGFSDREKDSVRRVYLKLLKYARSKEAYYGDCIEWDQCWLHRDTLFTDEEFDLREWKHKPLGEYENYEEFLGDFSSENEGFRQMLDDARATLVEELIDMPDSVYVAYEELIEKYSLAGSREFFKKIDEEILKTISSKEEPTHTEEYCIAFHWKHYQLAEADLNELIEVTRELLGK